MTPAQSTITLHDFQHSVAALDVRRPLTPPTYARRKVLATAGPTCPLCRNAYDLTARRGFSHPVIASCVHTSLGGPLTAENFFVCCRRCQQSRASSDLLAYPSLPDDLLTQRAAVLLLSDNHLVPLPRSASLADVREALAVRHALPRSRVYAAQAQDGTCLLGVSGRYGDGQAKGLTHLLARLAGSEVLREDGLVVYRLADEAFRGVVWDLIEANALVIGVARRAELRDARDYWWLTSASVGELRKRKVGGVLAPFEVRSRQVGDSALRMRRMAARRRQARELQAAQRELAAAETAVDLLLGARSNGAKSVFPTDPEEGLRIMRRYTLAAELVLQLRTDGHPGEFQTTVPG